MPSVVKISANRSVVVVPKVTGATIARFTSKTIGQLAPITIGQMSNQ